ncbi:hypothetical protein ACWD4O_44665 [Streptomyces sp. NPDC002623]
MLQRNAQIAVLGTQPGQALLLAGAAPVVRDPLGEAAVEVAVQHADAFPLTGLGELLRAVLADGLQQPVARPALAFGDEDDGLGDQTIEEIEDVCAGDPVHAGLGDPCADALGRLQAEAAGEHRQPVPQQPLGGRAQLMAPVDECPQGPLPGAGGAAAAGEQGEAVLQTVRHLFDGERAQPGGGQLDRQRQPVESGAQAGDGVPVGVGDVELRTVRGGPVAQQFDGLLR